jgi:DNA modification methylase
MDNMKFHTDQKFDVIFADYVYENTNFDWAEKYWPLLKEGGIFVGMTDFHSVFQYGFYMSLFKDSKLVSHYSWKNEWGNHSKDRPHQCFDDIIVTSKGTHKCFHSERIQVDKATKTKGLNPSGRETKTATAFIDDICLTTTALERIKTSDDHLVRWQKPNRLIQRILDPYTEEGDSVLDVFMGSGTVGEWCIKNNRNYIGLENDPEVFELAKKRLDNVLP